LEFPFLIMLAQLAQHCRVDAAKKIENEARVLKSFYF